MIFKIPWKILTIVVAFVLATNLVYWYYQTYLKIDPVALLDKAISQTLSSDSFCYRLKINLVKNSHQSLLSDVQGEKTSSGDYHLQGKMGGGLIEVYQIGDTTYLRSGGGKEWVEIPGNDVLEQEMFMVEINPLGILNFTVVEDIDYLGVQTFDGHKYYTLNCVPGLENEFLKTYFQDFKYCLWINRGDRRIGRAEIKAASKEDPSRKVQITVEYWDFGSPIKLHVPTTSD